MTTLQPGTLVSLKMTHAAPFGFFLTNGTDEILMHTNDALGTIKEGDTVQVFLFCDHQGRVAATQKIPTIQIGHYDWATAVSMHKKYGVFLDIGINKDILLSKDDLPDEWPDWPKAGDRVYCSLTLDKKNRLFAKLADESIISLIAHRASESARNQEVDAVVYRAVADGFHILTEESMWRGFLHEQEALGRLRIGQRIHCRVIDCKENGSVNVSMRPRSFEKIEVHAASILDYIEARDGAMPYSDKSTAEDIAARFQMSKGDFKKALGRLMKEKKVRQENGWTYKL
ncbi:MAG: S1-like domain-containing RNA-binding protein [Sporolactobacillus sp.]